MDELTREGKTATGALDFKVAALLCYLPVSFLHLIAAGVFLATEPKEHRFVRFHAVQSLFVFAFLFGGAMIALIGGMIVLPLLVMVIGGIAGGIVGSISEDLGALVGVIALGLSSISYIGGALLGMAMSLGFPVGMLGTGVWVAMGNEGRWPVLGRLAMRFA